MDETQKIDAASEDTPCPHCSEYLATAKRALADYANLKKEIEREKIEFAKFSNRQLLVDLLPAIDQFETALTHAPASIDATWLAGLTAVKAIWDSTFREIGLTPVPTDCVFDPTLHEAVAEEAVEGTLEGKIIRVVQNGWKLHEKLLRPAKVIIAKKP